MANPSLISPANHLPFWLFNSLFSANRWLHIVASTLLVGGVLFFVFIVPIATSDLKVEHQYAVFGKARWMFRKVVWFAIALLLLTGGLSLWRMWDIYAFDPLPGHGLASSTLPWLFAHLVFATLAAVILTGITATRKVRDHPIPWMWTVMGLLLLSLFVAGVARQMRLNVHDQLGVRQTYPAAQ